jgi:transcriptional regulator with XRE-family HTH domain
LKWSIDELADRSGIGRSTLYRLESGETPNPAYSTVVQLERVLGLKRGSLAFGAEVEQDADAQRSTVGR